MTAAETLLYCHELAGSRYWFSFASGETENPTISSLCSAGYLKRFTMYQQNPTNGRWDYEITPLGFKYIQELKNSA